jgi:chromate transport protein ChrA
MGSEIPADNIIATIIASLSALAFPLVLPFSHRFGRRALLRGVINVSIIVGVLMALFALRVPFDKMHQKRLFVIHQENVGRQIYLIVHVIDSQI